MKLAEDYVNNIPLGTYDRAIAIKEIKEAQHEALDYVLETLRQLDTYDAVKAIQAEKQSIGRP